MRILTRDALAELARLHQEMEEAEQRTQKLLMQMPANPDESLAAIEADEEARERFEGFHKQFFSNGTFQARGYGEGLHDGLPLLLDEQLGPLLDASGLPHAFRDHLHSCIREKRWNRTLEAIRESPEPVIGNLNRLVSECCDILGIGVEAVIAGSDFNPNDLHEDRFDSMIAELRAVVFLRNEGFENIHLLPAKPDRPRSDVFAELRGRRYNFDVLCSSASADRDVEDLRDYLLGRYRKKVPQLVASRQEYSCHASGVIMVVNSDAALIWGYQLSYLDILQRVHAGLGNPDEIHLVLVTGRESEISGMGESFSGPDDVVYPRWADTRLSACDASSEPPDRDPQYRRLTEPGRSHDRLSSSASARSPTSRRHTDGG